MPTRHFMTANRTAPTDSDRNARGRLMPLGLALLMIFVVSACDENSGADAAKLLNRHYKSVELAEGWDIDSVANTRNGVKVEVDIPRSAGSASRDELVKILMMACPDKKAKVWNTLRHNEGVTVEGSGGGLSEPITIYCPGPV